MRFRSIGAVLATAVGLLLPGKVQAAAVTWSNVQNITGPGTTTVTTINSIGGPGSGSTSTNGTNDVSTLGTQVFGINFSGGPGQSFPYDVNINGQAFYSFRDPSPLPVTYSSTEIIKPYPGFGTPGSPGQSYGVFDTGGGGGPNPDYTMANAVFSDSTTGSITLGSLTTGNRYQVQFWVSDPRGGSVLPTRVETVASSTGGDINIPTLHYEGTSGIDGQWVIGTFTADGTGNETLNLVASNSNSSTGDAGSAQVNLLQLRDITNTPEPTSLSLAGLGALGLLARRRRA